MNPAWGKQPFENGQKEQAWQEIMAQLQRGAEAASFEHEKNEKLQSFEDAGVEQLQTFKDAKREQLQRFADAQREQLQMNQARANNSFENAQMEQLQMIQAHANMANQFMQQMASAASSVADAASSMPHAVLVQQALPAFVSRPETQDMFRLPTLAGSPSLNQTLLSQFVNGL